MYWKDRIRELKERICKEKGVASDGMNIVHNGLWLYDDAQWGQTGVLDTDDLLHLRKR